MFKAKKTSKKDHIIGQERFCESLQEKSKTLEYSTHNANNILRYT